MTDQTICVHSSDKSYKFQTVPKIQLRAAASTVHIDESTIPNTNALGNAIWSTDTIYWKRESSYQWIDDKTMDKMIAAAFLESSIRTPLKIQQRNRKMSDAHIIINWLGKKDEPYFTSPSTLAFAWGPARSLGGDVTMNADVLWLLRKTPLLAKEAKELGYIQNYVNPDNRIKYFDPLHTFKHEGAGHALGMRHIEAATEAQHAIMYPFYNGLRKFGDADKNYLASLYGKIDITPIQEKTILDQIQDF